MSITGRKYKGFSLIELMIAMVVGLVLTLGLFTMFRMSSTNVTTTSHFNELQENGRIALTLMERDISQAGFMGDVTSGDMSFRLADGTIPIASDCRGMGADNGSYPLSSSFRLIWGYRVGNAPQGMTCFTQNNGPDDNTDVLQIKRVVGRQVNAVLDFNDENNHFVSTNGALAIFYRGNPVNGRPAELDNSYRDWDYAHHVYYIRSDDGVPSLRRRVLVNNNMDAVGGSQHHLVVGIEDMRFLYGVDTQGTNEPEAFLAAPDVPLSVWDRMEKPLAADGVQKIVAIKVFLLVRSVEEDRSYLNDISYRLGDLNLAPFNDGFRRKVLSSTIALDNFTVIDSAN
ncbi:pilus assembly protein PilW [Shewanella sp. OPT22]|nr:pilus assembly protein PilW [Shewanella sp. OPT22]